MRILLDENLDWRLVNLLSDGFCPSTLRVLSGLVVAALAGMGWTLSASELWVASQRAMPDWARGRMNATMVMVAQAATAFGGVIWGLAAHHAGVIPTFRGGAGFAFVIMIIVRVVPGLQISIDFTKSLSFESAPSTIFARGLDPGRLPAPQDGPVSITAEFNVDPTRRNECGIDA
jgi:MFS family permease